MTRVARRHGAASRTARGCPAVSTVSGAADLASTEGEFADGFGVAKAGLLERHMGAHTVAIDEGTDVRRVDTGQTRSVSDIQSERLLEVVGNVGLSCSKLLLKVARWFIVRITRSERAL